MRAEEFLKENASVGSTAAGNVATVVKPLLAKDKTDQSFFGGDPDEYPKYGDTTNVAIIRRPSPTAEANKRTK